MPISLLFFTVPFCESARLARHRPFSRVAQTGRRWYQIAARHTYYFVHEDLRATHTVHPLTATCRTVYGRCTVRQTMIMPYDLIRVDRLARGSGVEVRVLPSRPVIENVLVRRRYELLYDLGREIARRFRTETLRTDT